MNTECVKIFQFFKILVYLLHFRKFYRNQFWEWFNYYSLSIDISAQLYNIVPLICGELSSLDAEITSLYFPTYSCNEGSCTTFNISRFTVIESIEIGEKCFLSVQTFKIDGSNLLKTINIRSNSFVQKNNFNSPWKSFHILNCALLESIQIGEFSFSDFSGDFELKNLPQLRFIQFGSVNRHSANFHYSNFVIRGIDILLSMWWLDLPNLQSITLGLISFRYFISTVIESLKIYE